MSSAHKHECFEVTPLSRLQYLVLLLFINIVSGFLANIVFDQAALWPYIVLGAATGWLTGILAAKRLVDIGRVDTKESYDDVVNSFAFGVPVFYASIWGLEREILTGGWALLVSIGVFVAAIGITIFNFYLLFTAGSEAKEKKYKKLQTKKLEKEIQDIEARMAEKYRLEELQQRLKALKAVERAGNQQVVSTPTVGPS